MTGKEIHEKLLADESLLFYAIRGSTLYGTNTPESDMDYHGAFRMPNEDWLKMKKPVESLGDKNRDTVFYELKFFMQKLMSNNPTLIEMLYTPPEFVINSTPLFEELIKARQEFVTKKCYFSFMGYARDQIAKAKGKNKKVHKTAELLDLDGIEAMRELLYSDAISKEWIESRFSKDFFSYLVKGREEPLTSKTGFGEMDKNLKSTEIVPLLPPRREDFFLFMAEDTDPPMRPEPFLDNHCFCNYKVSSLEHMENTYRIYDYDGVGDGFFRNGEVVCSSIPKEDEGSKYYGLVKFSDGQYQSAKREWRSYWEWMANRNEDRWSHTDEEEGFEYDRKNMQHTVRLILSAENIALEGCPIIRFGGGNLGFLRNVRSGQYEYEWLLSYVEDKLEEVRELFDKSSLPDGVNTKKISDLYHELVMNY